MTLGRVMVSCGAAIALAACGTAGTSALPVPACADRVVLYAYGDTAQGLHPARPDSLFLPKLPAPHGHATLRLLVTPAGKVLRDSSRVVQTNNPEWGHTALAAALRTTFIPATRDGCAVYFWYEMTSNNP